MKVDNQMRAISINFVQISSRLINGQRLAACAGETSRARPPAGRAPGIGRRRRARGLGAAAGSARRLAGFRRLAHAPPGRPIGERLTADLAAPGGPAARSRQEARE